MIVLAYVVYWDELKEDFEKITCWISWKKEPKKVMLEVHESICCTCHASIETEMANILYISYMFRRNKLWVFPLLMKLEVIFKLNEKLEGYLKGDQIEGEFNKTKAIIYVNIEWLMTLTMCANAR